MSDDRFRIPGDLRPGYMPVSVAEAADDELPAAAWHITAKIRELHRLGIDGSNVTVAVNDTAGQTQHPFLPKQISGRDFTNSPNGLRDMQGHGMHCLGIVKSMLPKVRLITNKVLGDKGFGSTTGINAGRIDAAQNGADLISESLGDSGGPPVSADLAAYDKAYELGVSLCCAALGNAGNGSNTVGRPGSYVNHNHGVAAIQRDWRTIANFSSAGPAARFAGAGQDIISCRPNGGWVSMSGTSMATPWWTGANGMVLCWRRGDGLPDLVGPKAWADFYINNNLLIDLGTPGWDPRYGHGLVDFDKLFDFLIAKARKNV